jgi:hypothetical protein
MDDPNKKKEDGWFVSGQPHELQYFKDTIQKEFPRKTPADIAAAITYCRAAIRPSEGREKLKACVRKRLS